MRAGLKAAATSLVLALATACGSEAAPQGPEINPDPVIPDEEDEPSEVPLMLQQALGEFGECMSLEIWMRTGVYAVSEVETDENIACTSCHSDKTGGITLQSDDIVATFDYHTKMPAVMRLVTGTVDERGNFKDLVASNRYVEKGVDSCPGEDYGIVCHPSYTLPAPVQDSIATFVSETLVRWQTDTCDAPYSEEE
jgi:hypothetical protein